RSRRRLPCDAADAALRIRFKGLELCRQRSISLIFPRQRCKVLGRCTSAPLKAHEALNKAEDKTMTNQKDAPNETAATTTAAGPVTAPTVPVDAPKAHAAANQRTANAAAAHLAVDVSLDLAPVARRLAGCAP